MFNHNVFFLYINCMITVNIHVSAARLKFSTQITKFLTAKIPSDDIFKWKVSEV